MNRLNWKLQFRPAAPGREPKRGLFPFRGTLPVSATCRCTNGRKAWQVVNIPLSLANEIAWVPFRRQLSPIFSDQVQ